MVAAVRVCYRACGWDHRIGPGPGRVGGPEGPVRGRTVKENLAKPLFPPPDPSKPPRFLSGAPFSFFLVVLAESSSWFPVVVAKGSSTVQFTRPLLTPLVSGGDRPSPLGPRRRDLSKQHEKPPLSKGGGKVEGRRAHLSSLLLAFPFLPSLRRFRGRPPSSPRNYPHPPRLDGWPEPSRLGWARLLTRLTPPPSASASRRPPRAWGARDGRGIGLPAPGWDGTSTPPAVQGGP